MKITIVWKSLMSWYFVRCHKIIFQTDAESFSFLSWKAKKFYSWNKYFLKLYRKDCCGACCPNFKWRFCSLLLASATRKWNVFWSMSYWLGKSNSKSFTSIYCLKKSTCKIKVLYRYLCGHQLIELCNLVCFELD